MAEAANGRDLSAVTHLQLHHGLATRSGIALLKLSESLVPVVMQKIGHVEATVSSWGEKVGFSAYREVLTHGG